MEPDRKNAPEVPERMAAFIPQAVSAPLPAPQSSWSCRSTGPQTIVPRCALSCGDLANLFRAIEFRDLEGGLSCVMGSGSEKARGIISSDHHGWQNCIRSGRIPPRRRAPCRIDAGRPVVPHSRQAHGSFASKWRRRLWLALETLLRRSTRCRVSATLTTAICWALWTGLVNPLRRRRDLCSSHRRRRCRQLCRRQLCDCAEVPALTWKGGMHFPRRCRSGDYRAAPSFPTLNWMTR